MSPSAFGCLAQRSRSTRRLQIPGILGYHTEWKMRQMVKWQGCKLLLFYTLNLYSVNFSVWHLFQGSRGVRTLKITSARTYLVPWARTIWLWFNDLESITDFWHHVDWLWGPRSLLLNGCRGYSLLVKQPKLQT